MNFRDIVVSSQETTAIVSDCVERLNKETKAGASKDQLKNIREMLDAGIRDIDKQIGEIKSYLAANEDTISGHDKGILDRLEIRLNAVKTAAKAGNFEALKQDEEALREVLKSMRGGGKFKA